MSPIQQMLLGVGAVATKTYVDDLFKTYLYWGNESVRSINTGINMSGKGGLVWVKARNDSHQHHLFDTVRGANKMLASDADSDEATISNRVTAFNDNGFTLGSAGQVNGSSAYKYTSWSFRKSPGFMDIVEWTGNGSNRNIQHNLGCKPGLILVKRIDDPSDWIVYHKSFYQFQGSDHYYLKLNTDDDSFYGGAIWNNTSPTDTNFRIGQDAAVNTNNGEYIAYVFAGGESDSAEAKSVSFDGSGDYLRLASNADLCPGTSDFTFEAWIKKEGAWSTSIFQGVYVNGYESGVSGGLWIGNDPNVSSFVVRGGGVANYITAPYPERDQWTHIAVTRSGSTLSLFYNGLLQKSVSNSIDFPTTVTSIGSDGSGSDFKGKISNLRFVKGTAVYTSSFKPPTEPLTNITNTKLLCCNDSSTTGKTVGPTITANGNVSVSVDSPFFSKDHYQFGAEGNSDIIKCGYWLGNGSDTVDIDVFLGWEPQWLLVKQAGNDGNWQIVDAATSWPVSGNWETIRPNIASGAVVNNTETGIQLTPTGFKIVKNWGNFNTLNDQHLFLAIRRPDGYVGKPPELGTDVFAMDTGNGNTDGPAFDSGFPVDMGFRRLPATGNDGTPSTDWATYARLIGGVFLRTNTTASEQTSTRAKFDFNDGFNHTDDSTFQAWMWKRHAGFDVVAYKGDGVAGKQIPHSLSKTPEMMWVKRRDSTGNWRVFHKGLNGGTNPEQYRMILNTAENENTLTTIWNDEAPTSTHFTLGTHADVNGDGNDYIAILFASVASISKVGYYDGSDSTLTITTGFQPRFLIIKNITTSNTPWYVLDTTRGWTSSGGADDNYLQLNTTDAQTNYGFGAPTSTGFNLVGAINPFNASGENYIYYAHA